MNKTTTANWPKFRSHKIVQAARIVHIDGAILVDCGADRPLEPFKPTLAEMAKKAEIGGFAIIYEDGFRSISPAQAFLEGYTVVDDRSQPPSTMDVARVCHEVNRAICEASGDMSQRPWEQAEPWQRDSAVRGVAFALANPDASPEAQHNAWMKDKITDGWIWGAKKDADAKTHPCMVPYHLLPFEQRVKDHAFRAVVGALTA